MTSTYFNCAARVPPLDNPHEHGLRKIKTMIRLAEVWKHAERLEELREYEKLYQTALEATKQAEIDRFEKIIKPFRPYNAWYLRRS